MDGQTDVAVSLRHWPLAAAALDSHARIVAANRAMEALLGVKPGALEGRFLADWARDAGALARFLRDGSIPAVELDFRRSDAGEHRLALSIARGVAAGCDLLCAIDVTLARMTERSVRAERDRYLDMIRAASDWFYETETTSMSETKVEAWVRLIRSGPDGTVSQRELHTKWPERLVDQSFEPESMAEHMRKLNAREPIRDFIHRQARNDTSERYFRVSGVPYLKDGVYAGYRGVSIDVTAQVLAERALRESEARLRRAWHHLAQAQRVARIGSAERDLATGSAEWSPEFYRLFGLDPATAKPDTNRLLSLVHEDDRGWMKAAIAPSGYDGRPQAGVIRVRWPSGEVRMLHIGTDILSDDRGKPARIVMVARELTEEQAARAHPALASEP